MTYAWQALTSIGTTRGTLEINVLIMMTVNKKLSHKTLTSSATNGLTCSSADSLDVPNVRTLSTLIVPVFGFIHIPLSKLRSPRGTSFNCIFHRPPSGTIKLLPFLALSSYFLVHSRRTLNVSRKFSMCIIFSTGYIKIYNIKYFE